MAMPLNKPIIGEKPKCPKHPNNIINYVCSANKCSFRILCNECQNQHHSLNPLHMPQIVGINDWHKAYKRVSKYFDPRENAELNYQLEEFEMVLKKEKYHIEGIGKLMDDTFEAGFTNLVNKIKQLKEYFNSLLWKDFIVIYDEFQQIAQEYDKFKSMKPKEDIFEDMKKDLSAHFSSGQVKEYFDKVFSGHYDGLSHGKHFKWNEVTRKLKEDKAILERGIKHFDPQEFNSRWNEDINLFTKSVKLACEGLIFKEASLDFHSPKSPKIISFHDPKIVTPKLTCVADLRDISSTFIIPATSDILITSNESRKVRVLDSTQNYREIKSIICGDELMSSMTIVNYTKDRDPTNPVSFLLIGGNDDSPSIELWDYLGDQRLCDVQEAHEYGISALKVLKTVTKEDGQSFFVCSGSADGYVKIWELEIKVYGEDIVKFEAKIEQRMQCKAHEDFISSFMVIPKGETTKFSNLVSSSIDKSIHFWEWEREYDEVGSKSLMNGNSKKSLFEISDPKYTNKIVQAHCDRVNGLILLTDDPGSGEVNYFASGAGDGNVIIWDIETRKMLKSFSNKTRPVYSMDYLKQNLIACTANDREMQTFNVYVWNWKTGSLVISIRDHKWRVLRVVSLGNSKFATCDKNKVIKIWQVEIEK